MILIASLYLAEPDDSTLSPFVSHGSPPFVSVDLPWLLWLLG